MYQLRDRIEQKLSNPYEFCNINATRRVLFLSSYPTPAGLEKARKRQDRPGARDGGRAAISVPDFQQRGQVRVRAPMAMVAAGEGKKEVATGDRVSSELRGHGRGRVTARWEEEEDGERKNRVFSGPKTLERRIDDSFYYKPEITK